MLSGPRSYREWGFSALLMDWGALIEWQEPPVVEVSSPYYFWLGAQAYDAEDDPYRNEE